MMVHFPWLHPGLIHGPLPEGVVLFDPGVELASEFPRWRPENLPLSGACVRRLASEYVDFAQGLSRISDLRPYEAAGLEDFYTDTGMDIRSSLREKAAPEAASADDRRRRAQVALTLALSREEQFAALRGQEDRLARAQGGFAASLGLEAGDAFADQGVADALIFPRAGSDLPWRGMFGPLLCLVPEGTRFFVSDPDVAGELLSLGLSREAGAGGKDFIHLRVSPHDLEPVGDASLSAVIVVRPSEP